MPLNQYQWFDMSIVTGRFTFAHDLEWWTDGQTDRQKDAHMLTIPLGQGVIKWNIKYITVEQSR